MKTKATRFYAPWAWIQGAWASDVLLTVDSSGSWSGIQANAPPADRRGAVFLAGPVLPALVNAHSHAFQRAIAGLTEGRAGTGLAGSDDFWSWRDRMYSVALRITPSELESIATLLYAELLAGGYTQVCEFHYLHNAIDGRPYADPLEMSLALVRAAQRAGIGLTLLPTLYMRSGFGATGLRGDQRRFASTPDSVLRLVEGVRREAGSLSHVNVGVAVHSLRAADAVAIGEVAEFAARAGLPIHIHVAEQLQEVQDCVSQTGKRPIEWLCEHLRVDGHWNLVHATHAGPSELRSVSESGAGIVLCPTTEANLGDGVFDYSGYASVRGNWSLGSDSHVTRNWTEELRLLEYSQRLAQRKRNVAALAGSSKSSAAVLFEAALSGGQSATSLPLRGIAVGCRADFLVLDAQSPALLGVPAGNVLDALVFSSPSARFAEVHVAGNQVVVDGRARGSPPPQDQWPEIARNFAGTMNTLWPDRDSSP